MNMISRLLIMAAAIIQGAVIAGLTIFLVLGQVSVIKPEVSRVIAAGGAGNWFTFGYMMYISIGVIGVAVSSLFYHYLGRGRYGLGRATKGCKVDDRFCPKCRMVLSYDAYNETLEQQQIDQTAKLQERIDRLEQTFQKFLV